MIRHIRLDTAEDLRQFMNIAWQSDCDVGVHTPDGKIADAKSILGLMALDFTQPVMVVTEDDLFFHQLKAWLVD